MPKHNVTESEWQLIYFFEGTCGGFTRNLINAALVADQSNLVKLGYGFPELIDVIRRYKFESGYWENLQRRATELNQPSDDLSSDPLAQGE